MTAHPVLARCPEWIAYEARLQEARDKQDRLRLQLLEARRPYEEALAGYQERLQMAIDAGDDPPRSPEPPDLRHFDAALNLIRLEIYALLAEERDVFAQVHDRVEQAMLDREAARFATLAPLALQVEEMRREQEQDLRVLARVREGHDSLQAERIRPSRADRTRRQVATQDVLRAAAAGQSLLDPEPMPSLSRPRVEVEPLHVHFDPREDAAGRRLGLTVSTPGGFGIPKRQEPPPVNTRRMGEI